MERTLGARVFNFNQKLACRYPGLAQISPPLPWRWWRNLVLDNGQDTGIAKQQRVTKPKKHRHRRQASALSNSGIYSIYNRFK